MDFIQRLLFVASVFGRISWVLQSQLISIARFHSKNISRFLLRFFRDAKSSHTWNMVELLRILFLVFWAFALIFLFCEFGSMVNNRFEEFNLELDQCAWYSFSIQMQRVFVTITINAQQSTFVHGYANVLCVRPTFKTVKGENVLSKFEIDFSNSTAKNSNIFYHFIFPSFSTDGSSKLLLFYDAAPHWHLKLYGNME